MWFGAFLLFTIVELRRLCLMPAAGRATSPSTAVKGTGPVVHALCGKRLALLGEPPVHGFGETLEFKDELVCRLVDGCHYNAVFFESGTYDFIHIERILKSGMM